MTNAPYFTPEPAKSKRTVRHLARMERLVYLAIILTLIVFIIITTLPPSVVLVNVAAARGWQSTGVTVPQATTLTLTVTDGTWTNWDGTTPYTSGYGTGWICGRAMQPADCVEPLPSVPSDALIGRIGDQIFLVGGGTTLTAQQSGLLELRINDGDVGLYDNNGSLSVQINLN